MQYDRQQLERRLSEAEARAADAECAVLQLRQELDATAGERQWLHAEAGRSASLAQAQAAQLERWVETWNSVSTFHMDCYENVISFNWHVLMCGQGGNMTYRGRPLCVAGRGTSTQLELWVLRMVGLVCGACMWV